MAKWADHPFKDIYNLSKLYKDLEAARKGRTVVIVVGLLLVAFVLMQHFARTMLAAGQAWIGTPDLGPFYSPFAGLKWIAPLLHLYQADPHAVLAMIGWYAIPFSVAALPVLVAGQSAFKLAERRAPGPPDTHGSARIATFQDIKRDGFFNKRGPFLGIVKDAKGREYYVRADLEGHTLVVAPTGSGKAFDVDTKVLTPRGYVRLGDVRVGDVVIGRDGKPCNVTGVFPQGVKDAYRVTFDDGASVVCCDEHLWTVNAPGVREEVTLELRAIREAHQRRPQDRFTVPVVNPVTFSSMPLGVDAYRVGLLLATGRDERVELRELVHAGVGGRDATHPRYERTDRARGWDVAPEQRYIEEPYKLASTPERVALLQGLLDGAGIATGPGHVEFRCRSQRLADDVAFVAQSLGCLTTQRARRFVFRVTIRVAAGLEPFAAPSKSTTFHARSKPLAREIATISPVAAREMVCIAVDSPDNLYVVDGHVVTHNTTCYVYQLLTTWKGSVFVYDLKGENWTNTAGFRASSEGMCSKCLRLSLSDSHPDNAHFNPMDIIRIGTPDEYPDACDLVETLTDPEGKGAADSSTMSEGHFLTFASSLLTATILYVKHKYPPERQNLATVLEILSDPKAENTLEILTRMRDEDHDVLGQYGWVDDYGRPTRKNKYIVQPAVDIILMTEEARSNMIATCKRYLKPYRNPIVAAATAYSDFDIVDMVDPTKNISLYLIVAPSSKDSLKPVTRLIINMLLKKLTRRKPSGLVPERRLHLVLDEFDSLGRLPVFVDSAQFLRGYGMDCSIIIQGQNQLIARYSAQEMVTGACKNVIVFTPNDDDSCTKFSTRLGSFTWREKVPSSGKDGKESFRDYGRKLLEPYEVAMIPEDRALVFVRHHRPMYLYKRYAHTDPEFMYRTSVQAPFDLDEDGLMRLQDEGAPDAAAEYRVDELAKAA
jgi:type IV secretory pathway TraG/TraD family ATPase VirD4